jgi:hypothetical protein
MKRLLLLFFCLSYVITYSQVKVWAIKGGSGSSGGGGTFTPTQFVRINYTVAAGVGSVPANWNNVGASDAAITAGGITVNNLINSAGTTTGYSFIEGSTNWVSGYDAFTPPEAGTGAANSGVFPDLVVGWGWKFNDGATFTISGLTAGTTYGMNILFNAANFENATCSFTIAGVSSPTIDDSNNFGSSATNPFYTDPSLSRLTFTASGSSVVVTLHASTLNATFGVVNSVVLGY